MSTIYDSVAVAVTGPLTREFYRGALDRVREKTETAGLEGFLILDSYNLTYATGFFYRANERPLGVYVPVDGEPVLLVPHLEKENAEASWITDVRTYPEFPGVEHPVMWMLRQTGARRLAVDTLEARLFREASALVPMLELNSALEQLRFVKRPEELALVRMAAAYADACLDHMLGHIAATVASGGTEIDTLRCLEAAAACDAAAIDALRPGSTCHEVNEKAMAPLHHAGLGDFIRHRIGHGMGVQGHEGPWLAPGDTTVVAEGMVFSNEPGIYRPGIDGYRTINTMIVGSSGVEVPSRFQSSVPIAQRIVG